MAFVIKRNRAYEYRSIRRGGKVTSEYIGGGSIPAESAAFFREMEEGRRLERAMIRADWQAERGKLAEAERNIIEADVAYDGLAKLALIATGHHRPQRGPWRRRRAMIGSSHEKRSVKASSNSEGLVGAAEISALIDRLDDAPPADRQALDERVRVHLRRLMALAEGGDERGLPALRVIVARRPHYFAEIGLAEYALKAMARISAGTKDAFARDVVVQEVKRLRDEVAGASPSPLERLLAERVAFAWLDVTEADRRWATIAVEGCSFEKSEYHQRYRTRANQRFLAACKSLATVRRLALPALQVNVEVKTQAEPSHSEPFNLSKRSDLIASNSRN